MSFDSLLFCCHCRRSSPPSPTCAVQTILSESSRRAGARVRRARLDVMWGGRARPAHTDLYEMRVSMCWFGRPSAVLWCQCNHPHRRRCSPRADHPWHQFERSSAAAVAATAAEAAASLFVIAPIQSGASLRIGCARRFGETVSERVIDFQVCHVRLPRRRGGREGGGGGGMKLMKLGMQQSDGLPRPRSRSRVSNFTV